jgi:hypothetical protein
MTSRGAHCAPHFLPAGQTPSVTHKRVPSNRHARDMAIAHTRDHDTATSCDHHHDEQGGQRPASRRRAQCQISAFMPHAVIAIACGRTMGWGVPTAPPCPCQQGPMPQRHAESRDAGSAHMRHRLRCGDAAPLPQPHTREHAMPAPLPPPRSCTISLTHGRHQQHTPPACRRRCNRHDTARMT